MMNTDKCVNSVKSELYKKLAEGIEDVQNKKTKKFSEFIVEFERKHCK